MRYKVTLIDLALQQELRVSHGLLYRIQSNLAYSAQELWFAGPKIQAICKFY